MLVLAFFVGFWVYMGLGEMAGGDWSGISHLVVAALALALLALAWRRPLIWGWVLLVFGLGFGLMFRQPAQGDGWPINPGLVLMSAPFLLSGILLLLAGVMERGSGYR